MTFEIARNNQVGMEDFRGFLHIVAMDEKPE